MGKSGKKIFFIGTYYHRLDERNRFSVPKQFRRQLDEKGILTRGLDGCLFLYRFSDWQEIADQLPHSPLTKRDARSFSRHLLTGASEVEIDKIGRILVPKNLKDFAGLQNQLAILGVGNRVEIWSLSKWKKYQKEMEVSSEEVAERLTEMTNE